MTALAHSARQTAPAQSYQEHIANCRSCSRLNARRAARFYSGARREFVETVEAAAVFHDLGKLDDANQQVLRRISHDPLAVPHEDAGVERLLRLGRNESAVLVAAHHAGLFGQRVEMAKPAPFRNGGVADLVYQRSEEYFQSHLAEGCPTFASTVGTPLHNCGFSRRLALSCLVDADHGDTARHYGNEVRTKAVKPRWRERLEALDKFVAGLGEDGGSRNELRRSVYQECRTVPMDPSMRSCDAALGSGKTTAVMAYLLRVAEERNLHHIFVVLPYITIIRQSVSVLREALTLPGERAEDVVAEHHHQADFSEIDLRQLSTLWRAPVIVTTAVQFFETIAAAHPARLRKLHELPGSAVFLDEAHAALPSHLWPQVWRWLETWTQEWGGHIVFASGSLARFWELKDFVEPPKARSDVPDLLSDALRLQLSDGETLRITIRSVDKALNCDELIQRTLQEPGPRLLIVNTVQSAAVIADRMHAIGHDVMHLSTALAPVDRDRIVEKIRLRLQRQAGRDWTLVATSCVEAGMNFSFRTGLRERAGVANLIQVSGRIGRDGEYVAPIVWDFRVSDPELPANPTLEIPRRVLRDLLESGEVLRLPASELVTEAMRRELTAGGRQVSEKLFKAEAGMEYPEVSDLCRVIQTDTVTVVVNEALVARIRDGGRVGPQELQKNSVQIWANKVRELPVLPLSRRGSSASLYSWEAQYDPDFLGYMAGALQFKHHMLIV